MKRFGVIVVVTLMLSLGGFSGVLFAEVDIGSDFSGTLVLTSPEGEIQLVESGDSVPRIGSGSVIEVFDGQFTVTAGPADQVDISCLEHGVAVTGGTSVTLSCSEDKGLVTVVQGPVVLTDIIGSQVHLETGDTYPINLEASEEAPPAAQVDQIGFGVEGLPEVDSRNLDASPTA